MLLGRFRCAESERHLSPFGTVLRRCRSSVVPEKYDLWPNPPPAPPLGNKTDPEPLSILHQLGWAGIPDKAKLKLRCTGKLFAGHKRPRNQMSVFIARFGDISAHFCATSMQDGSISGSTRSSPNNPLAFLIIAHSLTPSIPPLLSTFCENLANLILIEISSVRDNFRTILGQSSRV